MRTPILLVAALVLPVAAAADEVFLKGGGKLSGRIVSRSETTIEVDVGAGRIAVPAVERPAHRGGALGPPGVRGAGREARRGRRRRLGRSRRVGRRPRPRDAGARGLPPRAGRVARRPAGERGPRQRADGRPVGERGRELQGAGLRAVPGGVDHPGRARGDPARARGRGRPGPRAPGGRVARARGGGAGGGGRGAGQEAEGGREAQQASEGIPLWYGWGAGPVDWPMGPIVGPPTPPRRPSRPPVRRPTVPR